MLRIEASAGSRGAGAAVPRVGRSRGVGVAACAEERLVVRRVSHRASARGAVRSTRASSRSGRGTIVVSRSAWGQGTRSGRRQGRASGAPTSPSHGEACPSGAVRWLVSRTMAAGVPESERWELAAEQLHEARVSASGPSSGACRPDVPRPSAHVCVAADCRGRLRTR